MAVEFYRHAINDTDIANVVKVLKSVFITTGPVCKEFEEKFSKVTGCRDTVAVNSCTGAIHLALIALGIGPGSEVITTPMTFIASATAILQAGATPIFVDVEEDTGLIDPAAIEQAITPKTKAILPVHLYGTMVDMVALRAIADLHKLHIIEDAAHCIEGERDGVRPGQLSDAVCYSFYATKSLTCGEGGALSTNNPDLAQKVMTLRQHGMSKEAAQRYSGRFNHWDMIDFGWKYNLDDIHAALLMSQVDRLQENYMKRKVAFNKYIDLFSSHPQVSIPKIVGKSALHLFTIQVPEALRDPLLVELGEQGVGATVNYRAIHTLSWFKDNYNFAVEDFPRARKFGAKTISLPFYPDMPDEDFKEVYREVNHGLKKAESCRKI